MNESTNAGVAADGAVDSAAGDPRVALVTGANKGIGLHIAHQLAQRGLLVLLESATPFVAAQRSLNCWGRA